MVLYKNRIEIHRVMPVFCFVLNALTDKINDREMFMKGIDYSYYYEEEDIVISDD